MNALLTFLKKFQYGKRLRPDQDWVVLLASFFALLAISLVWNLWLFDDVKSGAVLGTPSAPVTTLTGTERALAQLQQAFAHRASEEAAYETGGHAFADPSQ